MTISRKMKYVRWFGILLLIATTMMIVGSVWEMVAQRSFYAIRTLGLGIAYFAIGIHLLKQGHFSRW